jgi:hypothetical protein
MWPHCFGAEPCDGVRPRQSGARGSGAISGWRGALGLPVLVLLLGLGGCGDALFVEPGSSRAGIVLVYDLSPSSQVVGGVGDAFAKADRVVVRLSGGGSPDHVVTAMVSPSGGEARVELDVELNEAEESRSLEVELRVGTQPLFRGQATVVLRRGETARVTLSLNPVPAGVRPPEDIPVVRTLGDTIRLEVTALFATGDAIEGAVVVWSTLDPDIVEVLTDGRVIARAEGQARVVATVGDVSETLLIMVQATATGVQVLPPSASIFVAASQQFTARVHDARNNTLSNRTVTWSASQGIASVNSAGLATGGAPGTATITAGFEGLTGTAALTVRPRPPVAITASASAVLARAATLNGMVDPLDAPATAWFEYGTSSTLATFTTSSTVQVNLPGGSRPISFAASGLTPATTYYYRAVATGESGITRGSIVSFTTTSPPNPPTGLTATAVSATAIQLSWTDNSSNETEFRIERHSPSGGFGTIATVPANTVIFTNTGLQPQVTYTYRVLACSAAGCSDPSNEASATTLLVPPPAPTSPFARGISESEVRIQWTDASANEEDFRIEILRNGWSEVGRTDANATQFVVGDLDMQTIYLFRVRACNSVGCSPYTAEIEGWTQSPPAAFTGEATVLVMPDQSNNYFGTVRLRGEVAPFSLPTIARLEFMNEDDYYYESEDWLIGGEFEVDPEQFLVALAADILVDGEFFCYVYRIVAENALGTAYGGDSWFCFGSGNFVQPAQPAGGTGNASSSPAVPARRTGRNPVPDRPRRRKARTR